MTDKEAIERMERLAKGGTNFSEESNMACAIALAALREKQVAQQNAPLTLEELRGMEGEPVWTVGVSYTPDGSWAMWDIIEKVDEDGIEFGYSTEGREWWNYNLRGSDGKLCGCAWCVYRHPPEQ